MARFGRSGRIRGKSIRNPYGLLPQPLSPFDCDYLVRHLRAHLATPEEIDELFMCHTRLAISIVSQYSWRAPWLIDDLLQVAMLTLFVSISKAPEKLTNNDIVPYLTTRIRGRILDEIVNHGIISGRTHRRKVKQNDFTFPIYQPLTPNIDKMIDDPIRLLEIMEIVDQCIDAESNIKRREYKRVMVRLKAAGYTHKEIASIIEVSEFTVQSYLSDIKQLYYSKVQ